VYFDIINLRGHVGQNNKTSLCRQLGYIDISNLRDQIEQNDKNTLFR